MLRLKFIADKTFVLQHVLKSYSTNPLFWKLKRKIWDLDETAYYLLSQNIEPALFEPNPVLKIKKSVRNINTLLDNVFATKEFKTIFAAVEKNASFMQKQWTNNYALSLLHMEAITKIDLTTLNKPINVYVSHPLLQKGRSYVENNAIAFTHKEDWKNYSTVYLWHEIMHHITFDKKCNQGLMHALIELACDNELRIRLNDNGKYFIENGIPVGHKYLVNLEKKLLLDWQTYLDNTKNIYAFEKEMRRKYGGETALKPFSPLGWWVEWH